MTFLPITHPKTLRLMVALLLLGSAVPLAVALVSQFAFGLFPCEMCIVQRYPYVLAMLLLVPAFLYRGNARVLRLVLACAVLIWLTEAGLALYHVGIEQRWWDSVTGCTAQQGSSENLDDLRAAILGSPIVSCADAGVEFLGLSMASWNAAGALMLAWAGLVLLRRTSAQETP